MSMCLIHAVLLENKKLIINLFLVPEKGKTFGTNDAEIFPDYKFVTSDPDPDSVPDPESADLKPFPESRLSPNVGVDLEGFDKYLASQYSSTHGWVLNIEIGIEVKVLIIEIEQTCTTEALHWQDHLMQV